MDLSVISKARKQNHLTQRMTVGAGYLFSLSTLKRIENPCLCNGTEVMTLWNVLNVLGLKMVASSVSYAFDFQTTVDNLDVLSEMVSWYRGECGLTQKELATSIGIHTNTVHSLELGKHSPRLDTVMKIDRLLGINLQIIPA